MAARFKKTPKYRHYRPKNLGVVRLNGRDHYCPGPYNSDESLAHYHQLIADWRAGSLPVEAKSQPTAGDDKPATIEALILRYWSFVQTYYVKQGEATSEQSCIRGALKYLRRLFGSTSPASFTAANLEAVRQSMIEAGAARSTVNKHTGRVRRLFKWGAARDLVDPRVHQQLECVEGLRKGRSEVREPDPVCPVAEDQIRAAMPSLSTVLQGLVLFQWYTGCRPTEACLVRPRDVDRRGEVWCYSPTRHKTEHRGQQRRIYIGPQAQEILLPFLDRPEADFCFSPKEAVESDRDQQVSTKTLRDRARRPRPSRRGDHYTKDSYCRAIARACERVGIPRWMPNQLRHARATAIREKFGLEAAQTVLGHKTADVTQIYAEQDFGKAQQIMQEMG